MSHVWTGHKPLRRTWDDDVHEGDEFEATDAELQAFGDHIAEAAPDDDAEAPIDPRDYSVSDLRDAVADAGPSDAEMAAMADLEREREDGPRDTALDILE